MGRALRIPTRSEIRDVARLAAPIAVVQVGLMMMGVVDAAIVGRYSAEGLALGRAAARERASRF